MADIDEVKEKEEQGWACANLFCGSSDAGTPPKNCPKCGMSNPLIITGKFINYHTRKWCPNGDSFVKAVYDDFKRHEL